MSNNLNQNIFAEDGSFTFENVFKHKMIESFKRDCPDIAKEFNSDDDIWNYIMSNSEMSIKEVEDINNESD